MNSGALSRAPAAVIDIESDFSGARARGRDSAGHSAFTNTQMTSRLLCNIE